MTIVTSPIPRSSVPENISKQLDSNSNVCVVNGRDVFTAFADDSMIVMACNPRITHVIPGIMRAAEELDAVIAFELTATEGGLDGGYTGQTPEQFVSTILEHAGTCRFSKPFFIHADHITIKEDTPEEIERAAQLLDAQLAAGFTSFALDASFLPLTQNIRTVNRLAQAVTRAGLGLEVELGEVKHVGSESSITTVAETEEFLAGLAGAGITPQLLAIDNGSKSGNYLDGQMVNIDLERTGEIFQIARRFGVAGLVQHGITGTPLRIVGKLAEFGIRKGNIGTLWQNVAHAGLPLELMDEMRSWARENRRDIKYATGVFKEAIDAVPASNKEQIAEMARREALEFIKAFHAKGSASRLAAALASS